ncbi:hypothetical protein [Conexibacter sp. CPCC 206217]|uniref:hypothetical protein n=1 Tax=Conexibacter sp. CPCC 206217 TaxID=3064574 RepID=UPI002720EBDA|nr:hypothetical protein [Conexibacter sp. CPCC 206217]MDO8208966.1 hypothetical protein [Conexibacter sp. CPCC 206217]
MTPREQLSLQAWRAGYGLRTVSLISALALRCDDLERLDDSRVVQLRDALETCAQAGLDHEQLTEVAVCSQAHADAGEDWRVRFWSRILATANRRFVHRRRYGLSPCDRPTLPRGPLPADLRRLTGSPSRIGRPG